MKSRHLMFLFAIVTMLSSCVVVRQDEIAVKRRLGKMVGTPVTQGARLYNPFITNYLKIPTRIVNLKADLEIPSKEGLTIGSEMSILYRVKKDQVKSLLENVGEDYENDLIAPVFRSALADVSAKFMAKDMHTGNRASIENEVQQMISTTLESKGIIVEKVLMKRIVLPRSLSTAIEQKLAAEQRAQQMQFVLERERKEAERKVIEATGTANAQEVLSRGLSQQIIQLRSIEAFEKLSRSPNSKIIITNGSNPLLINESGSEQ